MELLRDFLIEEAPTMLKNQIELSTIGDIARLPPLLRAILDDVKQATAHLTGMRLTLALSYGARDEIVRAVRALARDVRSGIQEPDAIDVDDIARRLDTGDMPDPDLLIRTSGEMRVSNFLLWQIAYAELFITEVPWPAFARTTLDAAFAAYAKRQRRFGLTAAQIVGGAS